MARRQRTRSRSRRDPSLETSGRHDFSDLVDQPRQLVSPGPRRVTCDSYQLGTFCLTQRGILLTPFDPETKQALKIAAKAARKYRKALRELAKDVNDTEKRR
jgi:hypothetical protein